MITSTYWSCPICHRAIRWDGPYGIVEFNDSEGVMFHEQCVDTVGSHLCYEVARALRPLPRPPRPPSPPRPPRPPYFG